MNLTLPLKNKRILVTRTLTQSRELVDKITSLGGEPVVYPMIRIGEPESWSQCDNAIIHIKKYAGIIFTSVNGVRGFFNRLENKFPNVKDILKQKIIYAVGEKTEEILKDFEIRNVTTPPEYRAEALASLIQKDNPEGKYFLLPGGNLTREVLEQELSNYSAIVDKINVYQTMRPDAIDATRLEQQIKKNEVDIITFFSPSSVNNFFFFIEPVLVSQIPIAAIGPTTEEALREYGIEKIILPRESTTDSLIDSIVQFVSE